MKVTAQQLCFGYDRDAVFAGLSLEIPDHQVTALIGPNGVGKSTLVKCLNRIYQPQSGAVYIDGRELARVGSQELATLFGYVPQSEHQVFSLTVYEAVLLGRKPHIHWTVRAHDLQVVDEVMDRLQLTAMAERSINTLSGGERQKVSLARALAQEPRVLVLDEPTSSLDMNHQLELMSLVYALAHSNGVTVIMVLHDLNLAARFSDTIILLGSEGIHAAGTPESVLTPQHIQDIYGVEVEILQTSCGPYVVPLRTTTGVGA